MEWLNDIFTRALTFLTESGGGGMSFCTAEWWVVFVLFFDVYLLVRAAGRRAWATAYVVAFSLFFAYKANGALVWLLPASAVVSWWLTERLRTMRRGRLRRWWLGVTVVTELLPLAWFKYADFVQDLVSGLLGTGFAPLHLVLPLGISFYTFQAVSYSVDTFRGQLFCRVGLLDYLFYLTFFPLFFAGPITRANTLVPQLHQPYRVERELVWTGLWLVCLGLLKKAVVADYVGQYNAWVFDDPGAFSGFEVAAAAVGFAVQIYCDFSGYSDLAVGIAALMGFRLFANFNFPYKSRNVSEFWRRWHISLSSWMRDYIYIPLGGNRRGTVRTMLHCLLTMLVAGLWHGASLMFALWGLLHGAALVAHKSLRLLVLDRIGDGRAVRVVSRLLTFAFVTATWVVFRAADWETARTFFGQMASDFSWDYAVPFVTARPLWTALVAGALVLHFTPDGLARRVREAFVGGRWVVRLLVFVVVVELVIAMGTRSVQPFIYATF